MQITASVQSFWNHYSMQFGIRHEWDMEGSYFDFVRKNEASYKEAICLTLTDTDTNVSEWDIAMMGEGKLTEAGEVLMNKFHSMCAAHGDNQTLFVSMHSGSSDYLTVNKVLECFK